MRIRKAVIADEEIIYNLINELEKTVFDRTLFSKIFSENLKNPSVYYLIAEDENHFIGGFISLHIQQLLHHCGPIAEIQELCVWPHLRGQSIGKSLISETIKIAHLQSCKLIEVACNRKRTEAHRFYTSNGFSATHFKFTLDLK